MNIQKRYQGQILAVVLVILMVGVIIALAMMSRVGSDTIVTKEENFSSDALEVADTGLDAIKGVDINILAAAANSQAALCGGDPATYDFYSNGCTLVGLTEIENFFNAIRNQDNTIDLSSYINALNSTMQSQCSSTASEAESVKLILGRMDNNDPVVIEKDKVFSMVLRSPDAPSCSVDLNLSGSSTLLGAIISPIYAKVTGGEISQYMPYDNTVSYGTCISGANCGAGWATGSSQSIPMKKGDYSIYELRVRAIGGRVTLTRDFVGDCDNVAKNDMIQASTLVNCNGQSRGKQFVMTSDTFAPAIFDYVLFNGSGDLKLE